MKYTLPEGVTAVVTVRRGKETRAETRETVPGGDDPPLIGQHF